MSEGLGEGGLRAQWRTGADRDSVRQRDLVTTPPDLCNSQLLNTRTTLMPAAHSLEASHHTLAQLLERVPRLCTDGPRHPSLHNPE